MLSLLFGKKHPTKKIFSDSVFFYRKALWGRMLKGKHGSVDITPGTLFRVKYLGSTRTFEPGVTAIEKAVEKIQHEIKVAEKICPKVILEVTSDGIRFTEVKKSKGPRFIPLDSISYGAPANTNTVHLTNVFAFNHHISKSPLVVECHAVLCESEETSRAIRLAVYSAFREGHFRDLRRERKKSTDLREPLEMEMSPNKEPLQKTAVVKSELLLSERSECILKKNTSVDTENFMSAVDIGYEEKELDNIIQDLLRTVERETAKLEEGVE